MKNIFLISLLFFSITGCMEDYKDPLKENSAIQAREQIQAQNENTEYWTNKLLDDLEKRHRFINAVVGEYEGSFELKNKEFGLRFVFSSSIPQFLPNRDRTVEELVHELNNLSINAHILQWPTSTPYAAVGCIFEKVSPDYNKGTIDFFSKSCPSSYKLSIGDIANGTDNSSSMSNSIMNRTMDNIEIISGIFQSSTSATSLEFKVSKFK
jgi:hypothetical protein